MTVIVLTTCPASLRGDLTRWLLEISAGVFVGHVTAHVRTLLWARVTESRGQGRALMVYNHPNEQRLRFEVHDHHWEPVDFDGVTLIRRPSTKQFSPTRPKTGWSSAAKRRRFGRGQKPK